MMGDVTTDGWGRWWEIQGPGCRKYWRWRAVVKRLQWAPGGARGLSGTTAAGRPPVFTALYLVYSVPTCNPSAKWRFWSPAARSAAVGRCKGKTPEKGKCCTLWD